MKECAWCGRENEDDAVQCRECGTTEFKGVTAVAPIVVSEEPSHPSDSITYEIPPLSAAEAEYAWVTLVRCPTLAAADLVVSQLEAAGIAAFIPDEFLVQAAPWYAIATGFTRVQVSPKDYETARTLLNGDQPSD